MPDWSRRADELLEDCKFESLLVLVWGPGVPDASTPDEKRKGYNKRVQIREQISAQFPRSRVRFSEDPDMQALGPPTLSQLEREALHADIADLVVLLATSRGSELEMDHFIPTHPRIRDKIYVLIPERYKSTEGLSQEVLDYLRGVQVVGFTQDEFDLCKVATEKSVNITLGAALKKRLSG